MQIDYDVGDVIVKHIDSAFMPAGTIAKCSGLVDYEDGEGVRLFLDGESNRLDDWKGDFFWMGPGALEKTPQSIRRVHRANAQAETAQAQG